MRHKKNAKAAGTARERQVRKGLEEKGWIVARPGASLGAADLVAQKNGRCLYIQVKANKGNPFANFRPEERAELIRVAQAAGAEPWLCHWPPNGWKVWLDPPKWPKPKLTVALEQPSH